MDPYVLSHTIWLVSLALGIATIVQWYLWYKEERHGNTQNTRRLFRVRLIAWLAFVLIAGSATRTLPQDLFTTTFREVGMAYTDFLKEFSLLGLVAMYTMLLGMLSLPISLCLRAARLVWNKL